MARRLNALDDYLENNPFPYQEKAMLEDWNEPQEQYENQLNWESSTVRDNLYVKWSDIAWWSIDWLEDVLSAEEDW